MATVDGVVELPYITVDEPPGKEGYQAQHPDADVPSVPHWEDGENPPGTDPPTPPAVDPATVLPPGTDPFPVPEGAVADAVVEDTAPRTNPATTEIPGTHPFPFVPLVDESEFGLEEIPEEEPYCPPKPDYHE